MTLTQPSHDSFRWLAARVILLSATPVVLMALTVTSLLITAYGRDSQLPFGALAQAVVESAEDIPSGMGALRTRYPHAAVLRVQDGVIVAREGNFVLTEELEAQGVALAEVAGRQTSDHPFALQSASPPFPGSVAMVAVPVQPAGTVVMTMPLETLFPEMDFVWGMSLTIGGVISVLLLYNSLVFSGSVQQRLSATELRRRALEHRMVEANRLSALGTLASGVAHEINNPLSIMTEEAGWIQDLTEDDLPHEDFLHEVRASAGVIRAQGARCREITHNLLRLARQGVSEAGPVNLNRMVEEVAALCRHRCAGMNVSVRVKGQPDLPAVRAAQAHVQQILMNLTANALDAMQETPPERERTLVLETWSSGGTVHVSVADTGPGMSEAVRRRIFEPFFTTKPAGKGTGLGLAICYGLARRNDGALTVSSSEGVGSEFVLSLPVMESGTMAEQELAEMTDRESTAVEAHPGTEGVNA